MGRSGRFYDAKEKAPAGEGQGKSFRQYVALEAIEDLIGPEALQAVERLVQR